MPHRRVLVDDPNAGRRLDAVIRQLCPDVPLGVLMRWMRTGVVRLSGRKARPNTRLQVGDAIDLPHRLEAAGPPPRRFAKPHVVYEDETLLVVDKPAGLACHAGTGHEGDSLAARVIAYLHAEQAAPGCRPGLAQRLDRDVSGLIPIGKDAATLRALAAACLDKTYVALVHGQVKRGHGRIDLPLRVDDEPMGDRPRTHPDPAGKPALTHYRVAQRLAATTLLHVRIETGRTHQIRAHLRAIGHPVVADPRYGEVERDAALRRTHGARRLFLHAGTLNLTHPTRSEPLRFEAPLPEELARVLRALA